MTNKETIWNFFKCAGLSDAGTASLMGIIGINSDFNPQYLEESFKEKFNFTNESYTDAVDNGDYNNFSIDKAGYGLIQWNHYTKKLSLLTESKVKDKSIGDIEMQLNFLKKDMQKNFNKLWEYLKKTTNVYEATTQVLIAYRFFKNPFGVEKNKYHEMASLIYKEFIRKDTDTETKSVVPVITKINNSDYINGIATEVISGIWGDRWKENLLQKIEHAINEICINQSTERYYKVAAGDTLTKIANRFNTTIEKIISDNQITYPSIAKSCLNVGWILRI